MFSTTVRKLLLENRLARLKTNGKENYSTQKKIVRQLKNI